jgi:hypothetical protein
LSESFHSINEEKLETKTTNLSAVLIEFYTSKQRKYSKVSALYFERKKALKMMKFLKTSFLLFL